MSVTFKGVGLKTHLLAQTVCLAFFSSATNAQQFDANSYIDAMLMCATVAKSARDVARMRDADIPANVTLKLLRQEPYFKLPVLRGAAEEIIDMIYGSGLQTAPEDIGYFFYKGCTSEVRDVFQK